MQLPYRTNSGRWLTRSRSRSARSATAMAARRSSSTPAKSAFRITATPQGRTTPAPPDAHLVDVAGAVAVCVIVRESGRDDRRVNDDQPESYFREPPRLRSGTKRAHRFAGRHGSGGRRDWADVPPRLDVRVSTLGATFPRSLPAGVALRDVFRNGLDLDTWHVPQL